MSQKYELTGQIKLIGELQAFPSGFTKRQFIVTTEDDKYPQDIALEFVKDSCVKLDSFSIGDNVKVDFDIRGNEYNGKHFVQLSAWKIERIGQQREPQGARSSEYGKADVGRRTDQGGAKPPANVPDDFQEDDDIPF